MNEHYVMPAHPVNQDHAELFRFLAFIEAKKVRRYLEIGCRNGDSFYSVMMAIGQGGYGLAIDLPENNKTQGNLSKVAAKLEHDGIAVEVRFGNSQDRTVLDAVKVRQPFDLVLIDADHRYDGVLKDWLNYGQMAPIIAFHDVAAPEGHMSDGYPCGVPRLWAQLKEQYRTEEIVTPGSQMGFGILYQDKKR